ncbi:hypothetical protein D7231_35020, partial [Streptomyces klenkii]
RLYRQLEDTLAPAPAGGWYVSSLHGTTGSRPPASLTRADLTDGLRSGVTAALVSCVRDWADAGGHEHPDWPAGDDQRVTTLCRWLRWRLDWACGMHEGVGDSLHAISRLYRQTYAPATGERGERHVAVRCHCRAVLWVTVSTPGATCATCGARYGRQEAMKLPLAGRAGIAA